MTRQTGILMKEDMTMITIQIDEYINGFSAVGYDSDTRKKFLSEVQEERIEILKVIERWVKDEIINDLERRVSNASTM
jgi:hypothetical protein